ncbi:MAG: hypothetical protein ACREKL_07140 [Chthoniobacterales bacterium]
MKRSLFPLAIIAFGMSVHAADSPTKQELDRLRGECDRAVSNVSRPIYQKYQNVLDQMLHRAQQSNDTAAVTLINAEIERAILQTQTKEALLGLMSGSRWSWFDSSKPIGKTENWAEFYKNGTGVTSWGSSLTYEVVPPASLRVSQLTPMMTWFFTINMSKKEAVADAAATGQGEKRSLKFLRTAPPVNPAHTP